MVLTVGTVGDCRAAQLKAGNDELPAPLGGGPLMSLLGGDSLPPCLEGLQPPNMPAFDDSSPALPAFAPTLKRRRGLRFGRPGPRPELGSPPVLSTLLTPAGRDADALPPIMRPNLFTPSRRLLAADGLPPSLARRPAFFPRVRAPLLAAPAEHPDVDDATSDSEDDGLPMMPDFPPSFGLPGPSSGDAWPAVLPASPELGPALKKQPVPTTLLLVPGQSANGVAAGEAQKDLEAECEDDAEDDLLVLPELPMLDALSVHPRSC